MFVFPAPYVSAAPVTAMSFFDHSISTAQTIFTAPTASFVSKSGVSAGKFWMPGAMRPRLAGYRRLRNSIAVTTSAMPTFK